MSGLPTARHVFRSEDGRAFEHPDYTVERCLRCGSLYPLAKDAITGEGRSMCMRHECRAPEQKQGAEP